jgi:hypothetical protein
MVHSRYFRQIVLNAYQGRCAATGIGVRSLLMASHNLFLSLRKDHPLEPG